ncbi:hypothetical protein BH09BAC2_BH09BAC2_22520 [soil metagenome]
MSNYPEIKGFKILINIFKKIQIMKTKIISLCSLGLLLFTAPFSYAQLNIVGGLLMQVIV